MLRNNTMASIQEREKISNHFFLSFHYYFVLFYFYGILKGRRRKKKKIRVFFCVCVCFTSGLSVSHLIVFEKSEWRSFRNDSEKLNGRSEEKWNAPKTYAIVFAEDGGVKKRARERGNRRERNRQKKQRIVNSISRAVNTKNKPIVLKIRFHLFHFIVLQANGYFSLFFFLFFASRLLCSSLLLTIHAHLPKECGKCVNESKV